MSTTSDDSLFASRQPAPLNLSRICSSTTDTFCGDDGHLVYYTHFLLVIRGSTDPTPECTTVHRR